MSKFIAIDPGKYNTKAAFYDSSKKKYVKIKFRTKISEGSFDDDLLEAGTYIVQIDNGPVYKIGAGARAEAELETSKQTEIHRVCTMASIAIAACVDAKDLVACVGIPLSIGNIIDKRLSYRDYILPDGEHTVMYKLTANSPVQTCKFNFMKRIVYPESTGVIYEYPSKLGDITGIIDIGNLNTNCAYCANHEIQALNSFTDDKGGETLIRGLAQTLSGELGLRVDENLTAATLLKPMESRFLVPMNGNVEIQEKSAAIINNYLLEYVNDLKRRVDARRWPVSFMNICMIGGTTKLIFNELKQVFGNVFIPDFPEYVNAEGFLRKICANDNVDVKSGIHSVIN